MRRRPILVLVFVVLAALAGAYWWRERPLPVTIVPVVRGPAVDAVYATGTVEPSVMLPIAPRTGGRLASLAVDEGAIVRKDQVLARLDDQDLDSSVAELEARERFARQTYDRTQELIRRGVAAAIDLDRARSDLDAAIASLRRARSQRSYMALTAPAAGTIIRRDGEVGQYIAAGQAVLWLSCCAPLRVTADVDEEDIPRVRVGQKVVLRADAVPGRVFDGEVSEVTPKGDPVARSYRVRIRLADPGSLKVGMTVDANLIVTERNGALLVPASALQESAVWLARAGRAHLQPVKTGVAGEARVEILSGLEEGARVIDSPPEALREGRAVRAATGAAATGA